MGTDRAPSRLVRASITVGDFTPNLVTVPDVELLEVGEDWETSTGLFTFEEQDLLSAVESQADPAIRTPVLKLGHSDVRFDGQPSFGRIEGLRVTNNSQTLVGDLVGIPAWLAEVMPTAYPRRSVEGWFDYQAPVAGTQKWPFVLTALALLGAFYPAINTLEDLPILWGSQVPPMEPAAEGENDDLVSASNGMIRARKVVVPMPKWKPTVVEAATPDQTAETEPDEEAVSQTARSKRGKVSASVSIDNVRMAFYEQAGPGQCWWWIRQVLVNPFQLVVDDDEGGLYLIDVNVGTDDSIEFGEPQAVKVEYVAASDGQPAVAAGGQVVAARFGDARSSGGRIRASSEPEEEQETDDVKLSAENLAALGLKEGASDEEINQAVAAKIAATSADSTEQPDEEPDEMTEEETEEETTEEETPESTDQPSGHVTVPEGMVLVDKEQWQVVQQEVAASAKDRKARAEQDRNNYLAAAVKAGKFPPSRVEHYKKMWDLDPVGAKSAIDSLAEGLIPVSERGTSAETDPAVAASANAYPEAWKKGTVAAQATQSNKRVKVVND